MELLAENCFVITKAEYVEARLALSRDSYGKAAKKLGVILLLVVPVLLAGSWLLGLGAAALLMEALILALVGFYVFYRLPRSSAGAAYTALVKKWGAEPQRVTRFYADHLEIQGPGVNTTLSYSQIRQLLRTKHLLILVSDEDAGVLLKLDGFTLGGEAEVRRLVEACAAPESAALQ